MKFSEESIRDLFGHEAAEDESIDRLKEYYLKRSVYTTFKSKLPLLILVGHKGIGKSALFTVLEHEDTDEGNIAITIKPDDILDIEENEGQLIRKIQTWKLGLARILLHELNTELVEIVSDHLRVNRYQSWIDGVKSIIAACLNKKICDVNENYMDLQYSQVISLFKNSIFKEKTITVYLDDLDRGWKNTKGDIENLSALTNAVRDISRDVSNMRFRISLRSDVYYSIRTSDETTDKIDGSVRCLTWTNHEILVMLIKRIETYCGRTVNEEELLKLRQRELQSYLKDIFCEKFEGSGRWENAPIYRVLMSLIRKRPRDLIKLCTLAALQANKKGHTLIMTDDLEECFSNYSQDRLVDTCNEYQSEFPNIKSLLLQMRPTTKELQGRHPNRYTRAELLQKLKNIQSSNSFRDTSGRIFSENELAALLYKINFLTARKDINGEIVRQYYEESRYIYNEFTDFGADYEVHPAYRWALQPLEGNRISIIGQIELTD